MSETELKEKGAELKQSLQEEKARTQKAQRNVAQLRSILNDLLKMAAPANFSVKANKEGVFRSFFPDCKIPKNRTLPQELLSRFDKSPDRVVYIEGATGKEWTCKQLADMARALAAGLAEKGVKKGDVVAMFMPNMPQYFSVLFGALLLG